jgi:hypothetical protein
MSARALGYLQDQHDPRDYRFDDFMSYRKLKSTPSRVDHLHAIQSVLSQEQLGSCVANAGFGAIRLRHALDGVARPLLGNRLHGYWGARSYDGNADWDAGSRIRNFFRFVNAAGFMPEEETEHGYDILTFKEGPSREEQRRMFDQKNKAEGQVRYFRIAETGLNRKEQIKIALANNSPIVFGTDINQQFMDHSGEGVIRDFSEPFVGGHAMYGAGYTAEGLLTANSWGVHWGKAGICTLSWEYIMWEGTRDIWAISKAPYYSEYAS